MSINRKVKQFLCIDVGTTRFKTAIVTSLGEVIVKANYYYRNNPLRDLKSHFYDKEDFFNAFKTTLGDIQKEYSLNKISAIGITGHGQTLVPIGKDIIPIYKSFGFLDNRIAYYSDIIKRSEKDDAISLMYVPIVLYYKNEFRSIYNNVKAFLTPSDYISFLLTEKFFTSVSSHTIEPWKLETLKEFNIETNKFPKFIYMGQKIGETTLKAKQIFHIATNIPVFAMGGDFAMGELGTGTIDKGKAYQRFGTSAGINLCWDNEIKDKRILCYNHFIEGLFNISGIMNTAGISIDWAKRILAVKNIPGFSATQRGSMLFYPYLNGEKTPLWNSNAVASIIGIKNGTTDNDFLFSVFLGIAMGIRNSIEIIEKKKAQFYDPIVTSGWWSKVEWFMQMMANVTGKRYATVQTNDAEILGIAIVLSKALSIYPNLKKGVEYIVKINKIFKPISSINIYYDNYYKKYIKIRDKLYGSILSNYNFN